MLTDEDEAIAQKLLSDEKLEKFREIFKIAQKASEDIDKDKHVQTQIGTLVRCCAFFADIYFKKINMCENCPNNIEKFVENTDGRSIINGKICQSKRMNIFDAVRQMKLILPKMEKDEYTQIVLDIVHDFSFSNEMYRKFEDFFGLFFYDHAPYFLKLKKLIWTIYIYCRSVLNEHSRNILECLTLQFAVFSLILPYVSEEKFPKHLLLKLEKDGEVISKSELVVGTLCTKLNGSIDREKIISMREMIYRDISKRFDNIEKNLVNDDKINEFTLYFQALYEKTLKVNFFDERIFLLDSNISDSSPLKHTPFMRQNVVNLGQDEGVMKRPTACRALFFEKTAPSKEGLSGHVPTESINSKVLSTPNHMEFTPCSKVVYMDKWVKDFIFNWDSHNLLNYQNLYSPQNSTGEMIPITSFISSMLTKLEKLLQTYRTRIMTGLKDIQMLCERFAYNLLRREERQFKKEFIAKLLYNEAFVKAILSISFEIILFIENIEEISFYRVAETIELDLYDLWKIMNPFVQHDPCIPKPIRMHFEEIEYQLVSFVIWKNPSKKFKSEIESFFSANEEDKGETIEQSELDEARNMEFTHQSLFVFHDHKSLEEEGNFSPSKTTDNSALSMQSLISSVNMKSYKYIHAIYLLLRRLLNYSNILNKKIFENLNLKYEITKESEKMIKKILTTSNYIEILYEHHVDQIIICTIITILKLHKLFADGSRDIECCDTFQRTINFKKLEENYRKSKPDECESTLNSLFTKIRLYESSFVGICEYYSKIFSRKLQDLILEMKDEIENAGMEKNIRKRKMSVPEEVIHRTSKDTFNDESAFNENGLVYSPLEKKVVSKNRMMYGISTPNIRNYYSHSLAPNCTPMYNMSRSATGNSFINKTPRTVRLMESYMDFLRSDSGKGGVTKPSRTNLITRQLQFNPHVLQTKISFDMDASNNNNNSYLNNNNNIFTGNSRSNSISSSFNDNMNSIIYNSPSIKSANDAESTPEFNKIKQNK